MIAYVSGTGEGTAIALEDYGSDESIYDYTKLKRLSDSFNNYLYSGYSTCALIPQWQAPGSDGYIDFFKAFGGSGSYTYSGDGTLEYHVDGSFDATNFRTKLKNCGGDDFDESFQYLTGVQNYYEDYEKEQEGSSTGRDDWYYFYDIIDFSSEIIDVIMIQEGVETDIHLSEYAVRLCFDF